MNRSLGPEPLLPGIPSAPTGKRFVTTAEIDYQRRKRRLASRLPCLKPEDLVGTLDQPFYQVLLRDLMASGHSMVADEINNLLRKEERDRKTGKSKHRLPPEKLIDQPELLQRISDSLKLEQTLLQEGKRESAMLICKTLADQFLLQDKSVWLARHFYLAVLNRCRKLCPKTSDRLQAEIHCLLAYIAREHNESLETALAIAIDHLAVCRTLSRGQNWQFKPNTILIRLKKPIAFYGVTTDEVYDVVDACTMPLYMIATLLEHELLISLANQIMHSPHHKAPTEDDLNNAHEFADLALQLALEVRQPVALSSALTRFGMVLRHVGAFEDAMRYFQQLQTHATLTGDLATEAIAFHNLGLCAIGLLNSAEALEYFAKQKELSSALQTKELEGNAMHEMGHLLLQEGHLWESEECYTIAFEDFYLSHLEATRRAEEDSRNSQNGHQPQHDHHHHRRLSVVPMQEGVNRADISWGMSGVAAGQKLWARLAGLCRSGKPKDIRSVIQFKAGRKPLRPVSRPDYAVDEVQDIDRPWSNLKEGTGAVGFDEARAGDDYPDNGSDISWEEGFLFASTKDRGDRQRSRRVTFHALAEDDTDVIDETLQTATNAARNSQAAADDNDLDDVRNELDNDNARLSVHDRRRSTIHEKDISMRRSLVIAVEKKRTESVASFKPLMNKKPSTGALTVKIATAAVEVEADDDE